MRQLDSISSKAVLTGLTLLPLLALGVAPGTGSLWFSLAFCIHLLAMAAALVVSSRAIVAVAKGSPLAWVVLIGSGALIVTESIVPVTARDALIHHLAVPKWWLAEGSIRPIPWHEWSYYPMLVNLGYTGLMRLGLEVLLPLYHAFYLVILTGAISAFLLEETGSEEISRLGALICAGLPLSLRLASIPLVDLGLALYSALPFFLLASWRREPGGRPIALAGLSLGLAFGCKYNAILSNLLTLMCVPLLADGKKITIARTIRAAALMGLLALLVSSPWLVKNLAWTGNPIYPLYRGLFGDAGPERGITPSGLPALAYRMWRYGETPLDLALIPLRMILFGRDNDPRHFDGVLGPVVLLALYGAWRGRNDRWARASAVYSISYLALALLSSSARTRYLAPMAGPVLSLTALGALRLADLAGEKLRGTVITGTGSLIAVTAALYGAGMLIASAPLAFVRSGFDERAYLMTRIPELGMIEKLNELRPPGVTYLLFTGNRFYYYDVPVMSGGHFSEGLLRRWIKESGDPSELSTRLAANGVTNLVEHIPARLRFVESLPEDERPLWERFFREHASEVATVGPYRLLLVR